MARAPNETNENMCDVYNTYAQVLIAVWVTQDVPLHKLASTCLHVCSCATWHCRGLHHQLILTSWRAPKACSTRRGWSQSRCCHTDPCPWRWQHQHKSYSWRLVQRAVTQEVACITCFMDEQHADMLVVVHYMWHTMFRDHQASPLGGDVAIWQVHLPQHKHVWNTNAYALVPIAAVVPVAVRGTT